MRGRLTNADGIPAHGAKVDLETPRLPDRSARARVLRALGSIAALAIGLSLVLLSLMAQVARIVAEMQHDERAMHEGLMLGVAVREQYIHEAHTLIERSEAHLSHHHSWVEEVERAAAALIDRVPPAERWRVERIARTSLEIDRAFRERVVPAMRADDLPSVRAEHRRIDELVTRAAGDADHVALALEARMHAAHARAETAVGWSVFLAALGGVLAILLAVFHGAQVQARVLAPLEALARRTRAINDGAIPPPDVDGDREVRTVGVALFKLATDLKERETRLVTAGRLAAVGELAAGVAHEVNNPIGIIRGYLRTMIPEATTEELRTELRILDEEAAACQRIAEDLLNFARAGELRLASVDIAELAKEATVRLQATAALGGVTPLVRMDSALLSIDPVRMKQVLSNLLRNAAEADPGGEIELVGERSTTHYRIEVRDRGAGIPPEERDRVFEPFYGKSPLGSGLGLPVCLGVVRAHGGAITITDREGGGTKVIVELPDPDSAVRP